MHPPPERLREVFNVVERHVEERYGIPVIVRDVIDPFTGDFDGREIHIDHDVDIADAVFILVHLFGHTVQWCTSERSREIGRMAVADPSEEVLQELERYEREACAYSLELFHQAGIRDLDQWLANFSACDFAYLRHFYRTGEKTDFMSLWRENAPPLAPLEIPAFQPERWIARFEGVVI